MSAIALGGGLLLTLSLSGSIAYAMSGNAASNATTTSNTAPAASGAATPAASAATPAVFKLTAQTTAPAYAKPGYKPIALADIPAQFKLKRDNGNYWGVSGDQVTDSPTAAIFSADKPTGLYSATGTGLYGIKSAGKYVRHSGYVMWLHTYTPNNFDFAWQFMLKDGTNDEVIVWNPYPGNNIGMYVLADGTRQKIDLSTTTYKMEPVTGSTTSTFVPEPFNL
jgi:hypothetical protein